MITNKVNPGDVIYSQVDVLHSVRALLAGCISICRNHQGDAYAGEIDRIAMIADKALNEAICELDVIGVGLLRE
jgi:hypothetical protein